MVTVTDGGGCTRRQVRRGNDRSHDDDDKGGDVAWLPQREWLEKDFYKELGVSSTLRPTTYARRIGSWPTSSIGQEPGRHRGRERFKRVSEANSVPLIRRKKDYTTRPGRCSPAAAFAAAAASRAGSAAEAVPAAPPTPLAGISTSTICSVAVGTPVAASATFSAGCSAGAAEAVPRRAGPPAGHVVARTSDGDDALVPRRGQGHDGQHAGYQSVAVHHVPRQAVLNRAPARTCATAATARVSCQPGRVRVQRTLSRLSGHRIDHRRPVSGLPGNGVQVRPRNINVRIPVGVGTASGSGWPARARRECAGAPSGDLYVTVHVTGDKLFTRSGNDLKVELPVSFSSSCWVRRCRCRRSTERSGSRFRRTPPTAAPCAFAGGVCPNAPAGPATSSSPSGGGALTLDDKAVEDLKAYADAEGVWVRPAGRMGK